MKCEGLPSLTGARRWGREKLRALTELPEPNRVAEELCARHVDELLCAAVGCEPQHLFADSEQLLNEEAWVRYQSYVQRRMQQEPLQYILGQTSFREIELISGPGVLIPRPETERLVEHALSLFQGTETDFRIIDVGTGTGAIILSMLVELRSKFGTGFCRRGEFIATDVSTTALDYASRNAAALGVEEQVRFVPQAYLGGLSPRSSEASTLIISNPPYIESGAVLPISVSNYEPELALRAGEAGMDVIEPLIESCVSWIEAGAVLLLEIGDEQQSAVESCAAGSGKIDCRFIQDLQRVDRIAELTRCESSTLLKVGRGSRGQ